MSHTLVTGAAGFIGYHVSATLLARGDTVVDLFAGSGTTGAVAHELGRRFLLVDESEQAIAVMREALRDSGLDAEQIDYVSAHGTATRANDPVEASALGEVGVHDVAVHDDPPAADLHLGAAVGVEGDVERLVIVGITHAQSYPCHAKGLGKSLGHQQVRIIFDKLYHAFRIGKINIRLIQNNKNMFRYVAEKPIQRAR